MGTILRKASKYQVMHLEKYIVDLLDNLYPTELCKFIQLQGKRPGIRESFSNLNIARETKTLHLLPVLFFHCATSVPITKLSSAQSSPTPNNDAFFLDPHDKDMCLAGREVLTYRAMKLMRPICERKCVPSMKKSCVQSRRKWMDECMGRIENLPRLVLQDIDFSLLEEEACEECVGHIRTVVSQARTSLWDDLPGFFGLSKWDILRQGA